MCSLKYSLNCGRPGISYIDFYIKICRPRETSLLISETDKWSRDNPAKSAPVRSHKLERQTDVGEGDTHMVELILLLLIWLLQFY